MILRETQPDALSAPSVSGRSVAASSVTLEPYRRPTLPSQATTVAVVDPWKTTRREIEFRPDSGRYVSVERHQVQLPDGRIIDDWYWIVTPDFVNVLGEGPLTVRVGMVMARAILNRCF